MHEENAYDTDAIHEYGSPGNCPLLRYNVRAAWRPTYVFKKATQTLRQFAKVRGSKTKPVHDAHAKCTTRGCT